jgi:oligopeptidase A
MQQPTEANPLLSIQFRPPFDRIQASHVEPAIETLLEDARRRISGIASAGGEKTFGNTMAALDEAGEPLEYAMGVVRHLESVATTPELRAAFNAVQPPVAEFYSGIPLDEGLWSALKEYSATAEGASLTGERRRFLRKTIDTFRRHGADLDPAGKERLKALDVELTQLTTKFAENVLDSTNAFELIIENEADLAGLPPSATMAC